jgi:exodeoxyribonuclease VII large subunit
VRLERTRAELAGASELTSVRAEGFYAARRLEMERRLEQLAGGRQRVAVTRERLQDLTSRVNASTPRIRRRTLDYETAVNRHERQIRQAVERRVARMREHVRHLVAVIRARDFRERGWMLGATSGGEPVRSAASLAAGDRLELHLHDGRAAAKVDQVEISKQGEEH